MFEMSPTLNDAISNGCILLVIFILIDILVLSFCIMKENKKEENKDESDCKKKTK